MALKLTWIKWWDADSFKDGVSFIYWVKPSKENIMIAYTVLLPAIVSGKGKLKEIKPFPYIESDLPMRREPWKIEHTFIPTGTSKDLVTSRTLRKEGHAHALKVKKLFEKYRDWDKVDAIIKTHDKRASKNSESNKGKYKYRKK
jgi:hypothetical protein